MKRIILNLWHSIEEHDMLRLLDGLGYECLSLGAYLDPAAPGDDKRPPLPKVKRFPDLIELCRDTAEAKRNLPGELLEWAGRDGAMLVHHFPELTFAQMPRLRQWGGRVIWRSCGQSNPELEAVAAYYRSQGLERVAYSPKEAAIPNYAGHDALIRFYADPEEWGGWTGQDTQPFDESGRMVDSWTADKVPPRADWQPYVTNVTQKLFQRGSACNPSFWVAATRDLPRYPVGEGSEVDGGEGIVPLFQMKLLLGAARAYLYTGTRYAAYTLGFIEAAMTGIPIVSIGPRAWGDDRADWFEAHEMAYQHSDDPAVAREMLRTLLDNPDIAADASKWQRQRALELFGKDRIAAQWREYLS